VEDLRLLQQCTQRARFAQVGLRDLTGDRKNPPHGRVPWLLHSAQPNLHPAILREKEGRRCLGELPVIIGFGQAGRRHKDLRRQPETGRFQTGGELGPDARGSQLAHHPAILHVLFFEGKDVG
jgi:hypothetical protein